MLRKNQLKKIVLQCVRDEGMASSRQIWVKLWPLGSSHKNVSMTLLKCKRQRLLERTLFKRGRVREYLYMITERGKKRLTYYRVKEREVECGVVEIDDLVEEARKEVTPLLASSVGIFSCAEKLCNNASQPDVFSMGKQCAAMSAYQVMNKQELISAFAAKKLLSSVSPETLASIEKALKRSSIENLADSIEMFYVSSILNRLSEPFVRPSQGDIWTLFMLKRMRELHIGQGFLYRMFKEQEGMTEMYRSLYETERTHSIKLEKKSTGSYMNISRRSSRDLILNVPVSLLREFFNWHSTVTDCIIKTDLKIIEHLAKRLTHRDSSDVLWVTHYYIECLKENRKLADDNRRLVEKVERLEEEIYSLEDHVLRDPSIPLSPQ